MKTFTEIELLLEEIEQQKHVAKLMIRSGAAFRTYAGGNYFVSIYEKTNLLYKQLSSYPIQWVRAVELIVRLRE